MQAHLHGRSWLCIAFVISIGVGDVLHTLITCLLPVWLYFGIACCNVIPMPLNHSGISFLAIGCCIPDWCCIPRAYRKECSAMGMQYVVYT